MVAPEMDVVCLSVVIINYKTADLVIDCLNSLLPELAELKARVVIIDNASGDGSPDQIQAWIHENDTNSMVELIRSNNNGGFAAGNNIGIKAIKAQYYLLLNSDTLVRPGSIVRLIEIAGKNPEAGLISPRLEWPDETGQESCFRFPTPVSELMSAAKTGIIDRFLQKYIIAMPVQEKPVNPEWTSFACVLIRAQVFDSVGLLDEGYFMYFEDAEFCHRARKSGWPVLHDPSARVVHLRGGSSPVKKNTLQKKRLPGYFYESRTRFYYQLYGFFGLWAANMLWTLGRLISGLRQLLGRTDKAAIKRQWLDIWKNCLKPLNPYTHPES